MNKSQAEQFHDAVTVAKFNESKGKKIISGKKIYRKISAVESKTFGTTLRFSIPRVGQLVLKQVNLRVDLPALAGTGGAYIRFVNNIAIRLFESFQLWNSGQLVLESYPDEVVYNLLPNVDYSKWIKVASDIGNENSTTARNTLASATQSLVLDMKYVFDLFQKPFFINGLKDETNAIELQCKLQSNQNKIIQSDHTSISTLNISDIFIECIYQESPVIHNVIAGNHSKMIKELGGIGHSILVHDKVRRSIPIAASASLQADCDIRAFNNLKLTSLKFLIRDTADLTTANACDYDDDLKSCTSFQLKDASINLYLTEAQITDTEYRKMILPQTNYKGIDRIYNRNDYHLSFTEDQDDEYGKVKSFEGAFNTNNITDFRLNLFLASTSTAKTIDIMATSLKTLAIVGGSLKLLN